LRLRREARRVLLPDLRRALVLLAVAGPADPLARDLPSQIDLRARREPPTGLHAEVGHQVADSEVRALGDRIEVTAAGVADRECHRCYLLSKRGQVKGVTGQASVSNARQWPKAPA